MKIYDEITWEERTDPDLEAGFVYDSQRVIGHADEQLEVMEGTVTEARPQGLRRLVPARDITEPCQCYHAYTPEELAARAAAEQPSQLDRVDAQAEGGAWYPESMETWSDAQVVQHGTYVAMIATAEHQDEITEQFNAQFA